MTSSASRVGPALSSDADDDGEVAHHGGVHTLESIRKMSTTAEDPGGSAAATPAQNSADIALSSVTFLDPDDRRL
jgi:hypothetical protein